MTTTMEAIHPSKPEDLDAQATIHDFQDYTEYLPADLNRSLTLIHKLDEAYLARADAVHDQLIQYGSPKRLAPAKQPQVYRAEISYNLSQALNARESASGEADRLYEMLDRHYHRLASVTAKLHALPKPPSRDPTPVPKSPRLSRKSPPPKITLRLDGARASASAGRAAGQEKKQRSRRILVPGEVLPPRNPDSPTPFDDTDWESIPQSPLPMPTSRVGGSRRRSSNKPVRIRAPKPPKIPKERLPRAPRPPGTGTNVHSQVAGISTSNALSLLQPPPSDAKVGSEHAPWMRLTEYEMALLRKRMKKNAIWTPSETMIRRELADAGRGPENYQIKKAEAEDAGEEFIDCDNIANSTPGKPLGPGEISTDALGLASSNLSNRGMKLNEAKKLKREQMLAASLAETQQVARRLEDIGSGFKDLFSKPPSAALESPSNTTIMSNGNQAQQDKPKKKKSKPKEAAKDPAKTPSQKRKRDDTPKPEPPPAQPEPVPSPKEKPSKKRKTGHAPSPLTISTTTTTTIPLAAPATSPSKPPKSKPPTPTTPLMPAPAPKTSTPKHPPTPTATATSSRPRRISLTLKGPAEPPPSPARLPSRPLSRRASTGPPSATISREHLHRKSATPATPPPTMLVQTAAGRRSKRPAPGAVVESGEGGAAVSVGKRAEKPKRKAASAKSGKKTEDEAVVEEGVDPNEPRYCVCGDVSYGEMICCDDPDVSSPAFPLNIPSPWVVGMGSLLLPVELAPQVGRGRRMEDGEADADADGIGDSVKGNGSISRAWA